MVVAWVVFEENAIYNISMLNHIINHISKKSPNIKSNKILYMLLE